MSRLVNIANYHADKRVHEQKEQIVTKAKEVGWTSFVQDFPVYEELMEYANAVKQAMPNVTFLPIESGHVTHGDETNSAKTIRVYSELSIVMDGYPFDIGRINYKDNAVKANKSDYTYAVYSRKIKNAKYGTHRNQHNMITSSDLKKAVKNVCKYVVPFSTKELAQAFYDPMHSNVEKAYAIARRELRGHCEPLGHHFEEISKEIIRLKSMGVSFASEKFNAVAENLEEIYATFEYEASRKISATFVRIYKIGDTPYVSLQEVTDFKNYSWNGKIDAFAVDKPVTELSEDIVGSISVLSILENNQYVSNVGMKLDSNHFWIEKG